MILVDLNLALHAIDRDAARHAEARAWWESALNGPEPVGIAWITILGFLRVSTHSRQFADPLPVSAATEHVRDWLACPAVRVVEPGPRHAEIRCRWPVAGSRSPVGPPERGAAR